MGAGDELMASGMARGAAARGKRIAFGNGRRIIFGPHSEMIFRGNPNIAWPGDEGAGNIEWIAHHKGHRGYNSVGHDRWIWNYDFRPTPGELFFDDAEKAMAARTAPGFVLIEPNVPRQKSVAPNKQWRVDRFQLVADRLTAYGQRVVQLNYSDALYRLDRVQFIQTTSFREAMVGLSRAKLFIGPEGGMHHGAAALGIPAVVIFGGFIPPEVTGYDTHINLAAGGRACGSLRRCGHCRAALEEITDTQVFDAARSIISGRSPLRTDRGVGAGTELDARGGTGDIRRADASLSA